jgi:outer membrane lipoprotein LolB
VIARLAAAAVLVLASGCTALPPAAGTEDWPIRRERLQALERWTLNGRIAVAAGEDGFTGGFDWDQQGERAEITLSGPMGGSAMDIHVEGDQAVVTIRGESVASEDAEALFARYFGPGQKLPVEQMRYWLVGAPAPDAPHEESLGEDRRLASLSQAGWRVRYDRYESVGSLALPARMELATEGLRLRVAVSDWRLPP